MSPIEQLNEQLKETAVISGMKCDVNELREGQLQIIDMIKADRKANEDDFERGREKFKELFDEVAIMKMQIKDGFNDVKKSFNDHTIESKNDQIAELNKKLDARNYVKNGIIIALVGGIGVALAVFFLGLRS